MARNTDGGVGQKNAHGPVALTPSGVRSTSPFHRSWIIAENARVAPAPDECG